MNKKVWDLGDWDWGVRAGLGGLGSWGLRRGGARGRELGIGNWDFGKGGRDDDWDGFLGLPPVAFAGLGMVGRRGIGWLDWG